MNAGDAFLPMRAIARTLLYEGYALFPYGANSLKNQRRVSFGELALGGKIASAVPIEWSADTTLEARVGFLQPIRRSIGDALGREVAELAVNGAAYVSFTEAREITIPIGPFAIDALRRGPYVVPFATDAFDTIDRIATADGDLEATVRRVGQRIRGELCLELREASQAAMNAGVLHATLRHLGATDSADSELGSLHSPHLALSIQGGAFVSVIDPSPEHRALVETCEFEGWWPILIGAVGSRNWVLLSPIILYDHPEIAPESPGDLFDATENDELLTLSILALTDDERRAMQALDPRAAEILARCDALGERLGALHGAARSFDGVPRSQSPDAASSITTNVGVGDPVRLRTRGRDSFDAALDGQLGRVVGIQVEVSGKEHLVVVLDDDPGRDMGLQELGVGHRFFVARSEVERVDHRVESP